MYLGIVLILFGLAMGTGGIFFYLACLAFFLIIDYVYCPYEEMQLAGIFGTAYEHYLGDVRRWL
jgi:protein-S-isoprenylcysteine O-methyltransferase Ste14